jgi:hypothetical protein
MKFRNTMKRAPFNKKKAPFTRNLDLYLKKIYYGTTFGTQYFMVLETGYFGN